MSSPVPRDAGLCARCHKDFRLLSRRYNCRWATGGTGGGTGMAQLSPPALSAGCARARCAMRAPWTWASRGAAACFATSKGTRRLREPGPQPSHHAWDNPCPGCPLSDLLRTQASGACRQVLLPDISGLRRVFLAAGPQRGKQPAPATPVAPVSSISHRRIDLQAGCRVRECRYGGVRALLGGNRPHKGCPSCSQVEPASALSRSREAAAGRGDGSWPTAPASCQAARNRLGKRFPRCKGDGLSLPSTPTDPAHPQVPRAPRLGARGPPYPPTSQHTAGTH